MCICWWMNCVKTVLCLASFSYDIDILQYSGPSCVARQDDTSQYWHRRWDVKECKVKHHTDLITLMFSRSLPNWVEEITVKQMGISKLNYLTLHISVTVEINVKLKTRNVNIRKETIPSRGHTVSFLTHKFIYNL